MQDSKMQKCITPLNINGLNGRLLHLPAPKNKNKQILFLYGHHASLERSFGMVEVLNRYGAVTTPDLPGFGGMDSFYKIGKKPTVDNYADYLASFIKLRYKRRRVSIMATSFSFLIVTRMLQKYPELATKTDLVVSFVGFVHKDDFKFSPLSYWGLRTLSWAFKWPVSSALLRYLGLNSFVIEKSYKLVAGRHSKMKDADQDELDKRIAFETNLWQINDVRTRMHTMEEMLTIDLCNKQVKLPVHHIAVENDRYFDNEIVEQHMRVIYTDFDVIPTKITGHMPTVVATAKEAGPFVPEKLRRLLRK